MPDERLLGMSVREKLQALAPELKARRIDGLLVQRLDEIAYLSNLRGRELPFQATFKSIALVTPKTLHIGIPEKNVPDDVRR